MSSSARPSPRSPHRSRRHTRSPRTHHAPPVTAIAFAGLHQRSLFPYAYRARARALSLDRDLCHPIIASFSRCGRIALRDLVPRDSSSFTPPSRATVHHSPQTQKYNAGNLPTHQVQHFDPTPFSVCTRDPRWESHHLNSRGHKRHVNNGPGLPARHPVHPCPVTLTPLGTSHDAPPTVPPDHPPRPPRHAPSVAYVPPSTTPSRTDSTAR